MWRRKPELLSFIYVLRPKRPSLIDDASLEEESRLREHFEYLQRSLEEGKLILAGPCLDGEFGVVVFRAATEDAAVEFMRGDPAVRHGLMTAELHPFRVSLQAGADGRS
jgi:uncharacterized protein YciI